MKKRGFTLIETLTASVVLIVAISATTATITTFLKHNEEQRIYTYAHTISNQILNQKVRSLPFTSTTAQSLCGDDATEGTLAYKLKKMTVTATDKNTIAVTDSYFSIGKLPPPSQAQIEVAPINIGTKFSPVYSNSRVNVKVSVIWGGSANHPKRKVEQTTVITKNGIFDESLSPM